MLLYFLNQVYLETCRCVGIANFDWSLKVHLIAWMTFTVNNRLWGSTLYNVVVKCNILVISLVLNNHAIEYYTCFHYNTDEFFLHKSSKVTYYGKSSLWYIKGSFPVLLTDSWQSGNICLRTLGRWDSFNEYHVFWIYHVWKKISYLMLVIIDNKLTFKSLIFIQLLENRGADKDIYIIETSWKTKEHMSCLKVIWCKGFKDDSWHFIKSILNGTFHATRQFFRFQCMQSMLPNLPGKSRASATCNRQSTSAWFGFPKYSSTNTSMTLKKNFLMHSRVVLALFKYSSTQSAAIP